MKKIFTALCVLALSLTSFAGTFNIFIENKTGWEQTALYAWDDGRSDLLGGWPGMQATGIQGNELVFTVDESIVPANLIFNNNNQGSQLADFRLETAADIHLVATTGGLIPAGSPEPEIKTFHIHVTNQTTWDVFYLYEWGTPNEITGAWPGAEGNDFTFDAVVGGTVTLHLIFHNNVGEGLEGDHRQLIDLTEARDYYLIVTDTEVKEDEHQAIENVNLKENGRKMIVNGQLVIIRDGKMFNALGAQL